MTVRLDSLSHCMQGVVPSLIATCSRTGEPNVTYLSHVYHLDERHVALSCQFFNKTRRNVEENPIATIVMYDPVTIEAWRLCVRYLRSETEGELFDRMSARIQVIASHTGMAGIFRLLSADVYEVLALEPVEGFLLPADPLLDAPPAESGVGPLSELRGLQFVTERISRAGDLDELLRGVLAALDETFGFSHSMVFLHEPGTSRLVLSATRGYAEDQRDAAVEIGSGLIGTVAERREMVKLAGMGEQLRYGQAIRKRVSERTGGVGLDQQLPLPGLADAQVWLGLPLLAGDRLLGVLAMESVDPLRFDEWDEVYLQIISSHIAMGIERARAGPTAAPSQNGLPVRNFVYYPHDDCVFVDGEYLVRNLPGRILWKLLVRARDEGRTEWSNRELRLDRSLELPPVKDNLESRLILLRKRLDEKGVGVRLRPVRRGRFVLDLACQPHLVEQTDS